MQNNESQKQSTSTAAKLNLIQVHLLYCMATALKFFAPFTQTWGWVCQLKYHAYITFELL